jgi:hypothetical protein
VKNFISKTFCSEVPEVEPDPQDAKIQTEIQGILNTAWEGKLLDEDKKIVKIVINPIVHEVYEGSEA